MRRRRLQRGKGEQLLRVARDRLLGSDVCALRGQKSALLLLLKPQTLTLEPKVPLRRLRVEPHPHLRVRRTSLLLLRGPPPLLLGHRLSSNLPNLFIADRTSNEEVPTSLGGGGGESGDVGAGDVEDVHEGLWGKRVSGEGGEKGKTNPDGMRLVRGRVEERSGVAVGAVQSAQAELPLAVVTKDEGGGDTENREER